MNTISIFTLLKRSSLTYNMNDGYHGILNIDFFLFTESEGWNGWNASRFVNQDGIKYINLTTSYLW